MLTRRELMTRGILATTLFQAAVSLPGLTAAAANALPVRRSLGGMDLDHPDLEAWRDFVGISKSKPDSDPTNWISLANIHGDEVQFNRCAHDNWYFLPWHRGYLEMFERLVRAEMQYDGFALPYWDWTFDRQIPRAYSDATYNGKENPLYDPTREMTPTDSLSDESVGVEVMASIYAETDFEAFGTSRDPEQDSLDESWVTNGVGISGILEATPHNLVHAQVGGTLRQPQTAQDPLFMMHHGNVDHVWAVWNAMGNANGTDPLWLDMVFRNNFVNPDGTAYSFSVRDLLETEPLGYTYDLPSEMSALAFSSLTSETRHKGDYAALFDGRSGDTQIRSVRTENAASAQVLAPLDLPLQITSSEIAAALGESGATSSLPFVVTGQRPGAQKQIVAILREVTPPENTSSEYRVFVNCDYLSPDVPTSDPHYVGTLGFFGTSTMHQGHGGHGDRKPPSFLINLTGTLQRLTRLGQIRKDELVIQVQPVPMESRSDKTVSPITPRSIEVAII
ncbi:tyrosinase family protein [Nisaea denitrificans]|uniref:tyrosinase family protein n=1 Tax=Nisaea denitrificans TaxID=390877 RepID=UPI00048E8F59|nr:tyrosinase family protein [Nisaea denitrificans]